MNISTINIYQNIAGKSPPNSHSLSMYSNQSHANDGGFGKRASRCTFGVIAINSAKVHPSCDVRILSDIDYRDRVVFDESVALRDQIVLVGPDMRHVKQVVPSYRPSVTLHGESAGLRVACIQNHKILSVCDGPVTKISRPFPKSRCTLGVQGRRMVSGSIVR